MKRTFGLSILATALTANLLLSAQTFAQVRECCFQTTQQATCERCQHEVGETGVTADRSCCEPLKTHSAPKLSIPIPIQTQPDAHLVAVLPSPVAIIASAEDHALRILSNETNSPAVPDILTLHSRLNI